MLASGSELFRLMESGSCKTACSEGGTSVRSVCRNDRLQDAAYYSRLLGVAVVPRELTTPKLATVKRRGVQKPSSMQLSFPVSDCKASQ